MSYLALMQNKCQSIAQPIAAEQVNYLSTTIEQRLNADVRERRVANFLRQLGTGGFWLRENVSEGLGESAVEWFLKPHNGQTIVNNVHMFIPKIVVLGVFDEYSHEGSGVVAKMLNAQGAMIDEFTDTPTRQATFLARTEPIYPQGNWDAHRTLTDFLAFEDGYNLVDIVPSSDFL